MYLLESGNMKNIMVIDDDLNIRSALARELRFHNFNIIPAETGLMALNKLEKLSVDLIIVDIRMPVMDGVEFIRNSCYRTSKKPNYYPFRNRN